MSSEIKVNEFRKKQENTARNIIIDKMVAKEKKARGKKSERGNKEHIVELP